MQALSNHNMTNPANKIFTKNSDHVNLNELRLVVDEREKKSRIPDLLKAVGINVEVKTLPIGDYIEIGRASCRERV